MTAPRGRIVRLVGGPTPDPVESCPRVNGRGPAGSDGGKQGGIKLDALLLDRGIAPTSFDDWRTIEAAEAAAARTGSPREKFVRHSDWLKVLER